MACYAGLTGDYSRHPQDKAGLVRQQAGSRDKAEIRLAFEQRGLRYELIRGLQRPVRNILVREKEKDLTNATEIRAELENVLGLGRQIINDFLFVGQEALFGFVSAKAERRAEAMAQLLGLGHLGDCFQALGDQLREDAPTAISVAEDLDRANRRLAESQAQLEEVLSQVKAKRAYLSSKTEMEKARGIKAAVEQSEWTLALRHEKRKTLENAKAEYRKHREKSETVYERSRQLDLRLEEFLGEAESPEELHEALQRLQESFSRQQRQAEAAARLRAAEAKLAAAEQELADLQRRTATLVPSVSIRVHMETTEAAIAANAEKLKLIAKGEGCPLCEQPLAEGPEKLRRKIKQDDTRLKELLAHLKKQWSQAVAQEESLSVVTHRRNAAFAEKTTAESSQDLRSYRQNRTITEEELTQLRQQFQSAQSTKAERDACRFQQAGLAERLSLLREQMESLEEEIRQLPTQGPSSYTDEEYQEALARISRHEQANRELLVLRGQKHELEQLVASRQSEVQTWRSREEGLRRNQVWVTLLRTLREKVFHRDQLPRQLRATAMRRIGREVNLRLEGFSKPFRIEIDDNAEILAKFPDGTVMPATGLSGGQKVILALTYRMAATSLFAADLGMIVLDEPTDGLDLDNKDLAVEVFRRVGEAAKARNQQIFVITHEDLLERVFDQRFYLRSEPCEQV